MDNKVLSRSFAFFVLLLFSAFMSAASVVPSIDSATVYASEEVPFMSNILQGDLASANQQTNNNNNRGISSGMVTNSEEQKLFQGRTNINEDNDVIIGHCIDGHVQINDDNQITQTNIQSSNQESDIGDEVNDQAIIANKELQESSQVARNVNIDNDLIFILGCNGGSVELNDNDVVTQTNIQSSNQESDTGDELETDSE
jgi:NDP-sugar pyrophosphorylase family protein